MLDALEGRRVSMRVALVFPGQGSQRHGMLDALPQHDRLGRLIDAAEALSGLDLAHVAAQGTPEQLADTRAAQPLLYLADWAWGTEAMASGIAPVALAGHSLGEFAALALAGVMSVEAGLELVVERARIMAETDAGGGMAAVLGLDAGTLASALAGIHGVWLANDNAPDQSVISGTPEGLASAEAAAVGAGAKRFIRLRVSGAFHSPVMSDAAARFRQVLDEASFSDAVLPVVQNARPTPATDAGEIRSALEDQMVSPVRWTETMAALRDMGVETLVECGPGSVLRGLARGVNGVAALSVEQAGGIDAVLEEVR